MFLTASYADWKRRQPRHNEKVWINALLAKNFTVYEMNANKKQSATAPTQPTANTSTSTTEEQSAWIPTDWSKIFGQQQQQPAPPEQPAMQPTAPKDNTLTSLVLTGLIIVVVLGGVGGLFLYLKGKNKRGL